MELDPNIQQQMMQAEAQQQHLHATIQSIVNGMSLQAYTQMAMAHAASGEEPTREVGLRMAHNAQHISETYARWYLEHFGLIRPEGEDPAVRITDSRHWRVMRQWSFVVPFAIAGLVWFKHPETPLDGYVAVFGAWCTGVIMSKLGIV